MVCPSCLRIGFVLEVSPSAVFSFFPHSKCPEGRQGQTEYMAPLLVYRCKRKGRIRHWVVYLRQPEPGKRERQRDSILARVAHQNCTSCRSLPGHHQNTWGGDFCPHCQRVGIQSIRQRRGIRADARAGGWLEQPVFIRHCQDIQPGRRKATEQSCHV